MCIIMCRVPQHCCWNFFVNNKKSESEHFSPLFEKPSGETNSQSEQVSVFHKNNVK